MLAVDLGRFLEFIERLGSDVAVVSQLLDLEHAPIGGKANLAQRREVFEASAHPEVVGVVEGGFGSGGRPLRAVFVVLLQVGFFSRRARRGRRPR